jgi:hypothetical protein
LGDYIEIIRVFKLAKELSSVYGSLNLNIKLWLPMHEYYLALSREIFANQIKNGTFVVKKFKSNLVELADRYVKLIDFVKRMLKYDGDFSLEVTTKSSFEDQKELLLNLHSDTMENIINHKIPRVYGLYKGSEIRKELFAFLALKHIQPMLEKEDTHVLHIENSYEIWPSALASLWVKDMKNQIFSWICTPSIPSPTLKYMRTLNAPFDHKIYLGAEQDVISKQLQSIGTKYSLLISNLISEEKPNFTNPEENIETLKTKVREINSIF